MAVKQTPSEQGQVRPIIGITTCYEPAKDPDKNMPAWFTKDPYVEAVIKAVGGVPVLLPSAATAEASTIAALIDGWLGALDGILVTGSPSNVEPARYNGPPSAKGTEHDPARDAYTLPLIRAAIDRGVPLLAICRGHQELNVALGGSLHQLLHEVPGRFDHRDDESKPLPERFGPAHMVKHRPDGFFQIAMDCDESLVNSLHTQGIDRLATGLLEESVAPDGTIEAVSVKGAKNFAVGVQWHPEWHYETSETSMALFRAFQQSSIARHYERTGLAPVAASA
ncbi:MAG: gamma-glutamyl-gamma-aminobutyrate hydrolase family protein [Alphaproteobacteria bacterium]|nr:gamma-glutamyl-gamma-aminobutyrate hydrolase family protein [Alphaproteobacteria bacterium SS10]MBV6634248.1 gamma-glutamyl-gamma-aminobutyrate hydrolase family protein [Alphaproteobacteria bacterium SS10]